jgi:hypothetical protein
MTEGVCICNVASGDFDRPTSFQSEMNNAHLYQDPEYSLDACSWS